MRQCFKFFLVTPVFILCFSFAFAVGATAPKGSLSSASCTDFKGWACDSDSYSTALTVKFYSDGIVGAGTLLGTMIANGANSTASAKCGGKSAHGFSFSTPLSLKDSVSHKIYAYGVDSGSPEKSTLLDTVRTIKCANTIAPSISSIVVANGGEKGYIDKGDTIKITFSEAIKPTSINSSLSAGGSVAGISSSSTGGVSVSSSGVITIANIATFDMGSVSAAASFTSNLAFNSTAKILTITLTGGSINITSSSLASAAQIGGTVKDAGGSAMAAKSAVCTPTGAFGSGSDSDALSISSIVVANGGDEDHIDEGDTVKITFSEAIKPTSINSSLDEGGSVAGISSSSTGGVSVSSSGVITIANIATFDMGSVSAAASFTSKLALDSTAKILTITLTGGSINIVSSSLASAAQIGGTVKDAGGSAMAAKSAVCTPTGAFGSGSDSDALSISSIVVANGGDEDHIDEGDTIKITFSEAIKPTSINSSLDEGDSVSDVVYSKTGGVSVSTSGNVVVKNIVSFDMGSVDNSGTFGVKLALSSSGKILTITLADGDDVAITDEDFGSADQIGGTVKDADGNAMKSDSSIDDPTGSFGGSGGTGTITLAAKIAAIQAQIASLQRALALMTGGGAVVPAGKYSCNQITKVLRYETINDLEVKCLQEVLTAQGFVVTASGNYDLATKTAVMQFQQKYASEILAPYGLIVGSGNVGNNTKTKINTFLAIQ